MNIKQLKQIIKEELGDPSGEADYEALVGSRPRPTLPISPEAVDAVVAAMMQDEFLSRFVEKFKRYAQSGGSVEGALEATLPEYVPGKLISQVVTQVQGALTGEETPLPSRPSPAASPEEMDRYESDYFNENKTNKTKLKQLVKEELQSAVAEARGGDSLGELERIAATMHQAADGLAELGAGDQVEQYAAGFSDLAERLREAVAAHREEMSQPGW